MPSSFHTFHIRVYYEDTDLGGIVYHPNYLKFAERARTEMLRENGFDQYLLKEKEDLIFVIKELSIGYHKTSRLDDVLTVKTETVDVGPASLKMSQQIFRDDLLVASLVVTLATISPTTFKIKKMPVVLKNFFTNS